MKICSPEMGISPTSNLGGAVYDREILRGLAALGVEVHIPLPNNQVAEEVPGWHIYPTPRHFGYTYEYNLFFLPALLRLYRRRAFELLRIHTPSIGPLGWFFKRLTGLPVVGSYHHLETKRTIDLINRAVIHHYDLITINSHFSLEQYVSRYGVDRDKIVVAYPGVAGQYQPRRKRPDLAASLGLAEKTILLYLGVLTPRKNLRFLLHAFQLARRKQPDLALVVAGAGSEEAMLHELAARLNLSSGITFTGYVAEEQKVDLYNLADIFIFPSTMEGFGMAAAEAMACGIPIIASNAGSLPEVIGETGLLADPSDQEAFVECILSLASDPARRAALGQLGRERIRTHFSWEQSAAKTLAAYETINHAAGRFTSRKNQP